LSQRKEPPEFRRPFLTRNYATRERFLKQDVYSGF
jgi:hypothetical protein